MLIAIPMWLISKNQIKASKKRIVVFVFSFRLIVAAFSIATMATYFQYTNGSKASIGAGATVAWQEVLLGFSLMSASIPCLKNFLFAFMSTGLMTAYGTNNVTLSNSQGASNYHRSMHRSHNQSMMDSQTHDEPQSRSVASRLRPEWLEYKVDVRSHGREKKKRNNEHNARGENASVKSDGSEQMIIHRNVEVEIEHS